MFALLVKNKGKIMFKSDSNLSPKVSKIRKIACEIVQSSKINKKKGYLKIILFYPKPKMCKNWNAMCKIIT